GSFNSQSLYLDRAIQNQNYQGHWGFQWQRSDGFSRINQKRFKAPEKDGIKIIQGQNFSEFFLSPSLTLAILARASYGETDQDQNFSDSKDSSVEKSLILAPFLTYRVNK